MTELNKLTGVAFAAIVEVLHTEIGTTCLLWPRHGSCRKREGL